MISHLRGVFADGVRKRSFMLSREPMHCYFSTLFTTFASITAHFDGCLRTACSSTGCDA
jgi:hypothetical protein